MADMIKDPVFGEMEYKHRWIKKEKISLLDKEYNLNIIASAYSGVQICDKQREAYTAFKGKLEKISRRMPGMIEEYVEVHKSDIEEHFAEIGDPEDAIKYVKPVSVMFAREGKTVIMCNVDWDEYKQLSGKSALAESIRAFGIELLFIGISEKDYRRLQESMRKQNLLVKS